MNRLTTDFVSAGELTEIQAVVGEVMDDVQVRTSVTYRDYTGATHTPRTGAYTPAYTDTTCGAIRSDLGAREIAVSGGLYEQGDVTFLLAQADVAVTPTREDRVVCDSLTYEVIDWRKDPLGLTWRLIARRVK